MITDSALNSGRKGRAARRAVRQVTTAHDANVVRAGMPGGQYKPLSDHDLARLHDTALRILEDYGLADATPSMCELFYSR